MSTASWTRLRLTGNPVRLAVSPGLWAGAWYLLSYQVVGLALFGVVSALLLASALLAVTLAGLPVLIAAGAAIRGCANVERARLRIVSAAPVRGRYRVPARRGIMAQVGARWKDPATWRDIAYLFGLYAPLAVLGFAVLLAWLLLLAGVTVPAWYRLPRQDYPHGVVVHGIQFGYFPNGPHAAGGVGLYADTLPKALLAAAGCLVLWLLFSYVVVITARAHAIVAQALLRPPDDPLAAAKAVLARPGPLPSLVAETPEQAGGRAPPPPP